MKKTGFVIIVYLILSTFVWADNLYFQRCTLSFDSGVEIKGVLWAQTPQQQAKGLSGRKSPKNGMLFSFKGNEPVYFWMRNTHFPLSIGFFDQNGQLFKVADMQADTDDVHSSDLPAKYALELPLGQFSQFGLNDGVRLLNWNCE